MEENTDVLDIYVGGRTLDSSVYVTSLSGHIPLDNHPTYVSTNNFMILRFISDKTVQKTGFQASFATGTLW